MSENRLGAVQGLFVSYSILLSLFSPKLENNGSGSFRNGAVSSFLEDTSTEGYVGTEKTGQRAPS